MRRWGIALFIVLVLLAALVVEGRTVPRAADVIVDLANRPEVNDQFGDPHHGRFDASVFLFTSMLIVPYLALGLLFAGVIGHVLLEATVLPMGRRLGVPDRAVLSGVGLLVAGLAYTRTDVWVPTSLKLVAMVARAWVISTT